jgi:hypothetical protein
MCGGSWNKTGGSRLFGVKVARMTTDGRRGHQEDTTMWRTWNTLPAGWTYVMRVTLVAVVLFVAACTGPGHSSSVPSAHSPEGGLAGPLTSGNGDGGSGM